MINFNRDYTFLSDSGPHVTITNIKSTTTKTLDEAAFCWLAELECEFDEFLFEFFDIPKKWKNGHFLWKGPLSCWCSGAAGPPDLSGARPRPAICTGWTSHFESRPGRRPTGQRAPRTGSGSRCPPQPPLAD
ncbi:hypothetical protein BpHYR1_000347 [Brachionus plicatilis]|uniref:Uncharacterized protein n=1 Tax=Brachionus plicatilis TaxID=10195 RepID=A0A3M7SC54_BRAPC|nr:hypothetical protein BpHYR1_000347 [Brachionus plicatilis]